MTGLIGLGAAAGVVAVAALLISIARSGHLDRRPDWRTVAVLAVAGVVVLAGGIILWTAVRAG